MNPSDASDRVLVIEAGGSPRQYAREAWRYRDLLFILSWRDIKVRFKQTAIGASWALLRPLLTLIILTLVFSRIARLPSVGTAPYALLVLSGLLPWQFFAAGLSDAANSVVENEKIVTKIYFPRLVIPVSALAVCVVDFAISLLILAGIFAFYRYLPDWHLLALPVVLAFAVLVSLGPGLMLAALNVKYRDFRYVVPFLVQVGIYASPVAYSTSLVPERWRTFYYLNPMAGLIDTFRWTVLGHGFTPWWPGVGLSLGVALALLISGLLYFRATERSFADNI
ncbi:MAG TPA: ABC transporter permease [Steroidobacteraceae bacterium]|jgi:lipopolysaccharide transport system permease protein|nr:ABC transporter permease [Steroidobacteraceae bacterium]